MTDKKERNRTETGHNYAYYNGGVGGHVYNDIIYILIQTYADFDMSLVHRGDIKKFCVLPFPIMYFIISGFLAK